MQDDQAVQNVANVTEQNVANVTEKNVTSQEAIYCKKTIQDDYAQVSCLSCAELNAQFLSMKVSMQEEIARMQKELAELKAQKTLKDDPRVGTRDELTIS